MANPAPASFWAQANALFRKNLTYQKRNVKTNIRLILFPVLLCVILVVLQRIVDRVQSKDDGNICVKNSSKKEGDANWYATGDISKVPVCAVPNPPQWPPFLQLPNPLFSAVQTNILPFSDLPNHKCRARVECPLTMLFTASNFSFAQSVYGNMFTSPFDIDPTDIMGSLATNVMGSDTGSVDNIYLEPAFAFDGPIYYLQNQCKHNSTFNFTFEEGTVTFDEKEVRCVQCLRLWRNSSSDINSEIYKGYYNGNSKGQINEIAAAFDLLNSNENGFNVIIWHNSTRKRSDARSINLISNAYLQSVVGSGAKMLFDFVKEMPKHEILSRIDIGSLLGSLLYVWVIMQLFPVALASLVYEKEQKLRLMMQMHGLSDGPYWVISYGYFLAISVIYMLCFVVFGSLLGLNFFRLNDYSVQFVFYFIYINLQISVAFLVASMFSNVKTATVSAYIVVFATGLLAGFLSESSISSSLPSWWTIVMELYPGFALCRGLYEFADSAASGDGLRWENINDSTNGMIQVLIIMFVEWIVVLYVAYYIDQGRSPLSFFKRSRKKPSSSIQTLGMGKQQGYNDMVHLENSDIMEEREKVEQLLLQPTSNHAIVCDELKKVYPGQDGNPEKVAVRGLSLALPQGECFGMLGPNGAGKTSFINMMIGLTKPTAGTAYVQGLDIRNQINKIYTTTGVCPQHDLLWESLTGREHLLFYGRLKNLKGSALTRAVEESLKNLNIFDGGVADKRAGTYSGGMKRRLSVAISLIGDPKVVYMDEPSTGLDPASRNSLWNVIRVAKQDRAIILTTHSMEEAEALCDRLGIFVNGSLQCIGNPNELKSRYGGSYVFTMTTQVYHEKNVENMVLQFSPNAKKIYHISGTQKFELPKGEVRIADVFRAVENAKRHFTVSAWGLADTTMEDVFIKVARGAQESIDLS